MRDEIARDGRRTPPAGSRARSLLARTVTIKVRYADFTTITRSHTAPPTRDAAGIVARAVELLDRTEPARRPVRLLGVSVHNLCVGWRSRAGRLVAIWYRVRLKADTTLLSDSLECPS